MLALFFLLLVVDAANLPPGRSHVIMFIIDDLGWADVGYRGGDMSGVTPYLDSLQSEAITLERYYLQPVCSPSRAAFMQGRYPWTTGLQHFNTISPGSHAAMPFDQPTVAELFKKEGYTTSLVGKWHLGYARWSNTPLYRGFDSHKGYFQGEIDYFGKNFTIPSGILPYFNISGLDWWANKSVTRDEEGIYNKNLYDKEMYRVLDTYTPTEEHPLFMYYAHQVVHVPLEVPPTIWSENCTHIKDERRFTYCSMLASVDDSLRRLVDALKAKNMWDNTFLVVTSDNGGMPNIEGSIVPSAGVNFPYRGGKGLAFEGGVKGIGFVTGGDRVIPKNLRGTKNSELLHAVDWLPTFINLANAKEEENNDDAGVAVGVGKKEEKIPAKKERKTKLPANLDGYDLWDVLMNGAKIPRTNLPLILNHGIQYPSGGHQNAIIAGHWKLILQEITGPVFSYDGWYPAPPAKYIPPPNIPSWESPYKFLFNLTADPYETNNLYDFYPSIVADLEKLLEKWNEKYEAPQFNFPDPISFPELHDGVWAPFL